MESIYLAPLYCPRCGRLSLKHPQGLIEYGPQGLQPHPCKLLNKKNILFSPEIQNLAPALGVIDLQFSTKAYKSQRKQHEHQAALMLRRMEDGQLRALSMNNEIIELKCQFDSSQVKPGQLLRLPNLHRLGAGRFRLGELSLIHVPADLSDLNPLPQEYYRILLTGPDQNLVERVAEEFKNKSLDEGLLPFSLSIGPLLEEDGQTLFQRYLDLDPSQKLLAQLSEFSLPPQVKVSIQHRNL